MEWSAPSLMLCSIEVTSLTATRVMARIQGFRFVQSQLRLCKNEVKPTQVMVPRGGRIQAVHIIDLARGGTLDSSHSFLMFLFRVFHQRN